MTWGQKVREELIKNFTKSKKCQQAELTAIMLLNGRCVKKDEESGVYIYEDLSGSKRDFTVKRKKYNIKNDPDLSIDPRKIFKDPESRRAFLRGAFIASGSLNDPEKSYHFEILANEKFQAEGLKELMEAFDIQSGISKRRGRYVVYIKDGEAIVDVLNVMAAHVSLMEYENIRILKEMRGSVNRQVNCETANLNKTVTAALKQAEDIELLDKTIGIDNLEENLRQICRMRLEYPDMALAELGSMLTPALGKSGVNHRMRKISIMAENIRNNS